MAQCLTVWSLATLLLLAACGDDSSSTDAGARDGGPDARDDGIGIAPPEVPWLADGVPPLMMTPCPEGWREVVVDGVTECDPEPAEGPATCDLGEAHFLGEPGCSPIGAPCPAGDYAEALPTDGTVVYVNSAAAPGGDGSFAAPYASLSDLNWVWLSPGATVAIAKGTYEGALRVKEGVRVIGACAGETRITGDGGLELAAVTVLDGVGEATLENLTIAAASQWGVLVEGARTATLGGVLIEGAESVALVTFDAGTAVTIRDSVIRDTQPLPSDRTFGRAIVIQEGGELTATRLVITGNRDVGILAIGTGTTVTATDVAVTGTLPQLSDGLSGRGVSVIGGPRLTATRLLVARNHEIGMHVSGVGTDVELTDTVIRGTAPRTADDGWGRGLNVQTGAHLTATRLLVVDNRDTGVIADQSGTSLIMSDAIIRGTLSQASNGLGGRALVAQEGAALSATRVLISRNHEIGVLASGAGTTATLTDVTVRDTQPRSDDAYDGRGMHAQDGAHLNVTRALINRNRHVGISAGHETTVVTVADVVIRDTQPVLSNGIYGRGISADLGARLEGDRVVITDSAETGVLSFEGATVNLRDISIDDVAQTECETGPCPEYVFGHGVAAVAATLRLTGFDIREAQACGIFLATGTVSPTPPSLDLHSGVVSASTIGACVQVEGYDLGRLQGDVEYRDNGTSLDSTSLPVPTAAGGVGSTI